MTQRCPTMLFAFFQNPAMLFGLAAVSIPILIHLFFRSRFRVVPWGAMKFLLTSIEQTSRRLKFQEILLLVTRCVLIALVALALCLPTLQKTTGGDVNEPIEAVFLFDTSFSMGAKEGTKSRFDFAKERALALLAKLPPHSTVHVITCSNRAALAAPSLGDDPGALRSFGNPEQAAQIIRGLTLTSHSSDLEPGIKQALGVLERSLSPNKRLFVFSDMQKQAFEKNPSSIAQSLQAVKDKIGVYLVHAEKQKIQNVVVAGITPQSPVPRPGERCGFSILLKNTGTEELKDLRVGLFIDPTAGQTERFLAGDPIDPADKPGNLETAAVDTLAPGSTRLVTLTALLDKPGLHVLTACVNTDDLPGDNRFDLVLDVREQVQVLVVDGGIDTREAEKSSSYYLLHAILPAKADEAFYLFPKLVPPRLASPADLDKSAVCVLVNVPLPKAATRTEDDLPDAFLDALATFVRNGKGLMIFAGDNVSAEDYNRLLGRKHGLLPYPLGRLVERTMRDPLSLSRASATLPAYFKFRDDELHKFMDAVVVLKAFELQEPVEKRDDPKKEAAKAGEPKPGELKPDEKEERPVRKDEKEGAMVALRYDNGAPAVAVRRVGAGEVFFVTTSADQGVKKGTREPSWNMFSKTLGREYVPFIQTTLAHLLQQQAQTYNVVAGAGLTWLPKEKEPGRYTLIRPDKTEIPLGVPEKRGARFELALSDFDTAGVYRLKTVAAKAERKGEKAPEDPGIPLAVIPDLREVDNENGNLTSLDREQLNSLLGFSPVHLFTDGTQSAQEAIESFDMEWAHWLLVAALILAFFEVGLAFWCSRGW